MVNVYKQNMTFEAEVRYVAEAVWHMTPGECQPSHYPGDPVVRELDGIARLRDVTHLIMVTTSTKLQKLKDDVKKLNAAESLERRNALAVSKWFITQTQIDAQHIEHARKNNVTVLTLSQFKQRFFDGKKYLSHREVASFGSARNPSDNSVNISENAYVPLPMVEVTKVKVRDKKGWHFEEKERSVDIKELAKLVNEGSIIVLMAPFGSGKSLTTRELFRVLAKEFRSDRAGITPICLNLREHWGQSYFDEVLERHARSIGFAPKEDLVTAWRAGLVIVLSDGFDEVASQTIVRKDDINFMREGRRTALEGVKDFFTKLPNGVGAFICGRDHYFDNLSELEHALGLTGKEWRVVRLGEFTEEGANEFLRKNGIVFPLPDWLPRKPLILSYLIQNSLLEEILEIDAAEGFGYAWDAFIERISQRESEIERAVMDAQTVRFVLERLAFAVRTMASGTGPITGNDLASTYSTETGQPAGEGVLAQLQRLPGLTQRDQEAGSRYFVDADMLAALQGSALARLIFGQYRNTGPAPLAAISEKAVNVAAYLVRRNGGTSSTPISIAERLANDASDPANPQLAADCFAVASVMSREEGNPLDCQRVALDGAAIGKLDFEDVEIRDANFTNCIIEEVSVGPSVVDSGVQFTNCFIGKVKGIADKAGLPKGVFSDNCEVEEFDNMGTNNAVMNSDLAPQLKALLTVLRKLYRQAGAGRKIAALSRGITSADVQGYIPAVLDVLERNGFIRVFNNVVHPVRKKTDRVDSIMNAPSLSTDGILEEVKGL